MPFRDFGQGRGPDNNVVGMMWGQYFRREISFLLLLSLSTTAQP